MLVNCSFTPSISIVRNIHSYSDLLVLGWEPNYLLKLLFFCASKGLCSAVVRAVNYGLTQQLQSSQHDLAVGSHMCTDIIIAACLMGLFSWALKKQYAITDIIFIITDFQPLYRTMGTNSSHPTLCLFIMQWVSIYWIMTLSSSCPHMESLLCNTCFLFAIFLNW